MASGYRAPCVEIVLLGQIGVARIDACYLVCGCARASPFVGVGIHQQENDEAQHRECGGNDVDTKDEIKERHILFQFLLSLVYSFVAVV